MSDLERNKSKRKALRTATTKLIDKIEQEFVEVDKISLEVLKEYLVQIDEKVKALKDVNIEVEALLPVAQIEKDVLTSIDYDENLVKWKHKIKTQIEKITGVCNNESLTSSSNASVPASVISSDVPKHLTLKLPRLNIKTFYGDPTCYLEFFGQFDSAINKNPHLSKIEKMNYLKSFLGGAAASAISGLALTEQNFDAALDILKNRFGNTNTLIQAHMNSLMKISAVHNYNDLTGLRKLFDKIETHIRNLESLGVKNDTFGNLLIPIVLDRIPKDLVLEFNRKYPNEFTLKEVLSFLEQEIQSRERTFLLCPKLESVRFKSEKYSNERNNARKFEYNKFSKNNNPYQSQNTFSYAANVKRFCVFCHSPDHEFCEYKTVEDRKNKLKAENRCFRCFSKAHFSRNCRLKIECKFCKSKFHSYILCENGNKINKPEVQNSDAHNTKYDTSSEVDSAVIMQCNSRISKPNTLLLTCSVFASANNDLKNKIQVRLFCDTGSEKSWCHKSLANRLKLKVIRKERLSVYSFGALKAIERNYDVAKLKLTSRHDPRKFIEVEVLITDMITAAPVCLPDVNIQSILKERGFVLADDVSKTDQSIQVLLGGDAFWDIIQDLRVHKINKSLNCISTIFGFTLQGIQQSCDKYCSQGNVISNLSIGTDVQVLWDMESLGVKDKEELNPIDKSLIDQFERNLKFVNGRYETDLLWKSNYDELGNNYFLAKTRFDELKKVLSKNEWVSDEYNKIIIDQKKNEIIEECQRDKYEYFMPHRAVVREDKETTKVRIVFNCSSKSKGNPSLNDCLETGPNLNPNILDVILNFRKYEIAFSADIEKAFLMIGISEKDRKFLKFLWHSDNPNEEYKIMQMKRLPFGCKSSPFILSATIKHHIKKFEKTKPKSVEMLNSMLFVDDLYFGANSLSEAFELSSDAVTILKSGGFNLRKLRSNNRELEKMWMEKDLSDVQDEDTYQMKVLGLNWNSDKDELSLDVKGLMDSWKVFKNSKRCVLQTAARIFDPVGIIAPFVVRIKLLLQEIWERGIDWDEELPDDLRQKWVTWCSEIGKLSDVAIQRCCLSGCENEQVEAHVFCDASPSAYGAVVYFKYCDSIGNSRVSFIMSKSRVAPLKKLTLPRLELMSIVIGARVGSYIKSVYGDKIGRMVFWSDSSIALYWVKGCAKRWKQFVANRVMEVQERSSPSDWYYCPSEDNSADLLTRGVSAVSLKSSEKWWSGPSWLWEGRECWPKQLVRGSENVDGDDEEILKEQKAEVVKSFVVNLEVVEELWNKFSVWGKLHRVVAWCLRFIRNVRGNKISTPFLESRELKESHDLIIKLVQSKVYNDEISMLQKSKALKTSKLTGLNPFLDKCGLLRVGGRLRNTNLPESTKHPIILPKDHPVTKLLIKYYHIIYLHGGVQLVNSAMKQKYWIIAAKSAIRRVVRNCVICARFRGDLSKQMMADLPAARVNPGRPFVRCGIDYAGPFFISPRRGRGVRPLKMYVSVFVCFITKAVHLELVGDLSAEACIAALKRFIARRGKPLQIYSDCGKNFVGAKNYLRKCVAETIGCYLANESVEWKMNVPAAPHFGGLWEAAVKSMKFHLKRVIGSQILSQEEFYTILTEIEAVLNSRPLVATSEDPNDFTVITPGHFIIGTDFKCIPEPNLTTEKISIRERLNLITQIFQSFWKSWSKDYITQLQVRNKWKTSHDNLNVNDMVLIKDENMPPLKWKMGRVIHTYKGSDDKVRAVLVKTASGEFRRPIHKLVKLPVNDD